MTGFMTARQALCNHIRGHAQAAAQGVRDLLGEKMVQRIGLMPG
jgi:hypothetical protein